MMKNLSQAQMELLKQAAIDPFGWVSRYGVMEKTLHSLEKQGLIRKSAALIGAARMETIVAIETLLLEVHNMLQAPMNDMEKVYEKLTLAKDLSWQLSGTVYRITEDGRQAVLPAQTRTANE